MPGNDPDRQPSKLVDSITSEAPLSRVVLRLAQCYLVLHLLDAHARAWPLHMRLCDLHATAAEGKALSGHRHDLS